MCSYRTVPPQLSIVLRHLSYLGCSLFPWAEAVLSLSLPSSLPTWLPSLALFSFPCSYLKKKEKSPDLRNYFLAVGHWPETSLRVILPILRTAFPPSFPGHQALSLRIHLTVIVFISTPFGSFYSHSGLCCVIRKLYCSLHCYSVPMASYLSAPWKLKRTSAEPRFSFSCFSEPIPWCKRFRFIFVEFLLTA